MKSQSEILQITFNQSLTAYYSRNFQFARTIKNNPILHRNNYGNFKFEP